MFKRAIDGGDMLVDNVLNVSRYNNNNVRVLNTMVLQRIFGKNNRTEWADWIGIGNIAVPFITAINTLCQN